MTSQLHALAAALVAAGLSLAATALPAEFTVEPLRRSYDGGSDDLLTAGLGVAGLRGGPPPIADPLRPTPGELRRRAVYTAYRGLVDVSEDGGFGRLFGPREPRAAVPGVEYLVTVRKPGGAGTTTVMLQIPSCFDPQRPCLMVAASSGSRGVYGALPVVGAWGLESGCAVAYTDKGTGVGFHDLDTGTGYRMDLSATTDPDDPALLFRPASGAALDAYRSRFPHRLAVKHAHSGDNPEQDWGRYVLQAATAGLALLNREYPGRDGAARFTGDNTTVIAAGVSNGGGAVLRAVEADAQGLLDGAVVSEPNAQPLPVRGLAIRQGARRAVRAPGYGLFDYATLHYLLQPAAVLAPARPDSSVSQLNPALRPLWERWAAELAAAGLVTGATAEARARDAARQLEAAGILPEALGLGAANVQFGLWPAVAAAYASAYGRLPVEWPPCGVGYAATAGTGESRPLSPEERARLAADGSGVPPTGGVQLVAGAGSRHASFGSVDTALCFRAIATGAAADAGTTPDDVSALSARVRAGSEAVRMSAALHGRPVIILHGRRDGLIPVNHASRAYYARHRLLRETTARYYEVEHGQHFDAFLGLPGWGAEFVPLQPHLLRALDLMREHLESGAALPPSQVVRSTPRRVRDGGLEPLDARHLGAVLESPGADAIVLRRRTLRVPD